MISIVVHGILGSAYRQDVAVDSGSLADDDVKVLHDIRHYLSNQYGDGTPTTGWALSVAPSGMWLHRVERAFDTNYAPAYLMFSFLIPRGKRLDDEAVLGQISRAMILNHSNFIRQNVIQYECDWSFLSPLSRDVEGNLVSDGSAVSGYTAPADGEVAFYQGGLPQMLRNMWNVSFARYGTVFCGKGLLTADREHPSVEVVEADPNSEMEMRQNPVADTIADRLADAEPQPEPMRTDNVNPPVDGNPQSKDWIMPDPRIDHPCVYGPPIPPIPPVKGKKARMFHDVLSPKGRIRRLEYGLTVVFFMIHVFLLLMAAGELAYLIDEEGCPESCISFFSLSWVLLWILSSWVLLVQGAKRCHDIGRSGWFQLIPFYPYVMLFKNGERGDNEYGANPKGAVTSENPIASKRSITALVIWISLVVVLLISYKRGSDSVMEVRRDNNEYVIEEVVVEDDESIIMDSVEETVAEEMVEPIVEKKINVSQESNLFPCLTWENVKDGGKLFYEKYEVDDKHLKSEADLIIHLARHVHREDYVMAYERAHGHIYHLEHELHEMMEK